MTSAVGGGSNADSSESRLDRFRVGRAECGILTRHEYILPNILKAGSKKSIFWLMAQQSAEGEFSS
ncbi:MAG: hypothetical protein LBD14_05240 [Puniceicoccales bacterium]|jgi:hypothetical protein|nr:hypothetical protein [Puniceicoccales bacterium]